MWNSGFGFEELPIPLIIALYVGSQVASSRATVITHISIPGITEIQCENTGDLYISCPSGEILTIVSGFYGRTQPDAAVCPFGGNHNDDTNCVDAGSEDKIRSLCGGHRACSIPSGGPLFVDPCPGTYQYVKVTYTCGGKEGCQ